MSGFVSSLGFGGKTSPNAVTRYTSGSGTFTGASNTRWLYVTLIPGGGGGGSLTGATSGSAGGGQSGKPISFWMAYSAPVSYGVGAGGTVGAINGNTGGDTTFGTNTAYGGLGGQGLNGSGTTFLNPNGETNGWGRSTSGYGAGGLGGTGSAPSAGSAGGPGLIIVQEYS